MDDNKMCTKCGMPMDGEEGDMHAACKEGESEGGEGAPSGEAQM